jgi:hypothetical protein
VTQPKLLQLGILTALCAVLAACQTVVDSPTERPIPSPTPPPPTAVPPIQLVSHHVSQGPGPGEWRVVGLVENQGQMLVIQVQLSVSLLDSTGKVIAEKSTNPLMSNLLPGEASPFLASFEGAAAPAEAQVEILSHEPTTSLPAGDRPVDSQPESGRSPDGRPADNRPELATELEEFFVTGSGELAIMGFIVNPGNRYIALDSLGFLGRAPNDIEKSLAVMQFGPKLLAPEETAPFLALAPENPGAVQWIPYHDGWVTEPPNPQTLEILGDPTLHVTAQGAPFVVGTLANSGDPADGSVMISLFNEDRFIGLLELETPRPLKAGEQLPFAAFGFPGISLRFNSGDPSAIRVETRVEEIAAHGAPTLIDMPVDVSTFLSVGSAIFIRGTVHNPMDFDVDTATVYAEVRSSNGELLTAGWSTAGSFGPGASGEFVLDLPIPVGLDATLTEYDLRAIGLKAQP